MQRKNEDALIEPVKFKQQNFWIIFLAEKLQKKSKYSTQRYIDVFLLTPDLPIQTDTINSFLKHTRQFEQRLQLKLSLSNRQFKAELNKNIKEWALLKALRHQKSWPYAFQIAGINIKAIENRRYNKLCYYEKWIIFLCLQIQGKDSTNFQSYISIILNRNIHIIMNFKKDFNRDQALSLHFHQKLFMLLNYQKEKVYKIYYHYERIIINTIRQKLGWNQLIRQLNLVEVYKNNYLMQAQQSSWLKFICLQFKKFTVFKNKHFYIHPQIKIAKQKIPFFQKKLKSILQLNLNDFPFHFTCQIQRILLVQLKKKQFQWSDAKDEINLLKRIYIEVQRAKIKQNEKINENQIIQLSNSSLKKQVSDSYSNSKQFCLIKKQTKDHFVIIQDNQNYQQQNDESVKCQFTFEKSQDIRLKIQNAESSPKINDSPVRLNEKMKEFSPIQDLQWLLFLLEQNYGMTDKISPGIIMKEFIYPFFNANKAAIQQNGFKRLQNTHNYQQSKSFQKKQLVLSLLEKLYPQTRYRKYKSSNYLENQSQIINQRQSNIILDNEKACFKVQINQTIQKEQKVSRKNFEIQQSGLNNEFTDQQDIIIRILMNQKYQNTSLLRVFVNKSFEKMKKYYESLQIKENNTNKVSCDIDEMLQFYCKNSSAIEDIMYKKVQYLIKNIVQKESERTDRWKEATKLK